MEKYAMFLDRKNQYSETTYTIQSNLYIQCNPYQATRGIFHRKQPRCPSADEWIRKLWYIYTMEYYSAIKMNTCESILMKWMKLEPIIQSEVSQKEKPKINLS